MNYQYCEFVLSIAPSSTTKKRFGTFLPEQETLPTIALEMLNVSRQLEEVYGALDPRLGPVTSTKDTN